MPTSYDSMRKRSTKKQSRVTRRGFIIGMNFRPGTGKDWTTYESLLTSFPVKRAQLGTGRSDHKIKCADSVLLSLINKRSLKSI